MAVNTRNKIITNGLVLYLDASNPKSYTSGSSIWYDLSGNNNNGYLFDILYNTSSFLTFDGTVNSVCRISHSSNLSIANPTVELVLHASSHTGQICAKGAYTRHWNYGIVRFSPSQIHARNNNGDAVIHSSSSLVNIVTAVWNGTAVDFYKNGTYISQSSLSYSPIQGVYNLNIGAVGNGTNDTLTNPWRGSIQSLKVYNRVLSPSEIQENFDVVKGRIGL